MSLKSILAAVLFSMLGIIQIFAGVYSVQGVKLSVGKFYTSSNTRYDNGDYNIGNNYSSFMQTGSTYRTQYRFAVPNIPANEVISGIKLIYGNGQFNPSKNYKFNVTHMTTFFYYATGALYDTIASSQAIFSEILCDLSGEITNNTFSTLVNSKLGTNLYLGGISANENQSDSFCNLSLTIEITTYSTIVTFNATNNFQTSSGNGQIIVDGVQVAAPYAKTKLVGETAVLQCIPDQVDINNYQRVWVNGSIWEKTKANGQNDQIGNNTNIFYTTLPLTSADANATYKANFKKMCNVTVGRNNPYGGIVKILLNGQEYSDPSGSLTKSVLEQNSITLSAENQTANYVDFNFQGWRNNATDSIESTNLQYTISPEVHKSYTAIFKGYAKVNMLNTQDNGNSVGQNPTITWTDNPNQNVYYRVYRSPGLNGETWALASTVQKGVQTFNDGYHIITGSKEGDFCALRLEAVYSPDNTEVLADNVYFNTEEVAWKSTAKNSKDQVITKYAIANYPNPFNPTTVINYQVPEAGHVTVKVYDVMGKEIATLVDGAKNKGSYNINFSMDQYHLSSGIYFCRMQAGKNITTTKMILSK